MGLDVTAYRKLKTLKKGEDPGTEKWPLYDGRFFEYPKRTSTWVSDWQEECFPGRAEGLPKNPENDDSFTYEECFDFRAGSYGGYDDWRDLLEKFGDLLVSEKKEAENPFMEHVDFPDNEGIIGPVCAAKLSDAYGRNMEHAEKFAEGVGGDEGAWWLGRYRDWKKAFAMAADGGCVNFH